MAESAVSDKVAACNSRALLFAVAAGLPPQMTYSVEQTARYLGVTKSVIYREHDAGRIKFVLAVGNSKGNRINVDEVDRWLNER